MTFEQDGRWQQAIPVPGLAALSKGRRTEVDAVSCAPAGTCAAGGDYKDSNGHNQGYVAVERGRWYQAIPVPGLAALDKGEEAGVWHLSCGSPGSCTAGGDYTNRRGHGSGFVTQAR